MKRRKFVQNLLVAPVAPAALAAQQIKPQPTPQANAPAPVVPRQRPEVPKLAVTQADLTSQPDRHFFTAEQFAALEKLGSVLMPPIKGNPGAVEAGAPEFLDFLVGVSPEDRQNLYRDGLDGLNAQAQRHFDKAFGDLNSPQADAIIRPLLVARFWSKNLPADPMKNFMAQVHDDLRTATANSREWAAAEAASGRRQRGFNRSIGYYWKPIDPVVRD